jgi:hypothetical protein
MAPPDGCETQSRGESSAVIWLVIDSKPLKVKIAKEEVIMCDMIDRIDDLWYPPFKSCTTNFMTFPNTTAIACHKKKRQIHLFVCHAILVVFGNAMNRAVCRNHVSSEYLPGTYST